MFDDLRGVDKYIKRKKWGMQVYMPFIEMCMAHNMEDHSEEHIPTKCGTQGSFGLFDHNCNDLISRGEFKRTISRIGNDDGGVS